MHFVLTGFSHNTGLRVFAFEGIAADFTRTSFSVSADVELSRRHGIRVQELPLICLRILEQHDTGEQERNLTFAEEDMRAYRDKCAAERDAAVRRKRPPRPFPGVRGPNPMGVSPAAASNDEGVWTAYEANKSQGNPAEAPNDLRRV
jgi:hypothetical protein